MLQFVPAILLLLIQGHAGSDRLGSGNGLPATILALSSETGSVQSPGRDRSVASFLALSKQNPSLSAVLIGILKSIQEAPCELADSPTDLSDLKAFSGSARYDEPPCNVRSESLASVSRFRDGPALS